MKIFISAVTKEFGGCRNAIANALKKIHHDPVVQPDFVQHPQFSTLEKLSELVRDCDCLVAIVGDMYGAGPDRDVNRNVPQRSYTQWEYYFSAAEGINGKKLVFNSMRRLPRLVYFASDQFLNAANLSNPELCKLRSKECENGNYVEQQRFKQELKRRKDRDEFDSVDQLVTKVVIDVVRIARVRLLLKVTVLAFLLSAVALFAWLRPLPVYTPPPPPAFSELPGGDILKLIYTSKMPIDAGKPVPELQCDIFVAEETLQALNTARNADTLLTRSDSFFIGVNSLSAGYLYIFTIGSSGSVETFLTTTPTSNSAVTSPIQANKTVILPNSNTESNSALYLDNTAGFEHYYFVFCQSQWSELEHLLESSQTNKWPAGKSIPPFQFFDRGSRRTSPMKPASIRVSFGDKSATREIESQPIRATNGFLVIERWFKHETR